MSDEEIDEVPEEPVPDGPDDYVLQDKDATFVVESPTKYYTTWESDAEYEDYQVNKNSKAARRRDIITYYEIERNKALAKLEEEDSDDDWFVENPKANQKKENSEADRAVTTNMSPLANQEKGELEALATNMNPLANQKKENLEADRAVATNMSPLANQEKEEMEAVATTNMNPLANLEKKELKVVATDMGPLANQEKEKLKAVGSDERRGIKRKLEQ